MNEQPQNQNQQTEQAQHDHPQSPAQAVAEQPAVNQATPGHSRRAFLFKLSVLLNGAVGVVLAVPLVRYMLGPAIGKGSNFGSWITLGPLTNFPVGQTRLADFVSPVASFDDGQTAKTACWVRRVSDQKFQVFAINCAHLGCPVRWFAQSHLFLCPCHGGAYYEDGTRASGPPERGLFEYRYKVDGSNLMIHAGNMPTLATQACNKENPLVNIAPASSDSTSARSEWPA